MSNTLQLRFGITCPKCSEQIKEQGLKLKHGTSKHWYRRMVALCELRVIGILTDGEAHKASRRFMDKIKEDIV